MANASPAPADFWRLGLEAWQLWSDAGAVIAMRTARMMRGGCLAEREAQRMVEEKLVANTMLGWALLPLFLSAATPTALGREALRHYQKPVGANRRRLGRAKH